MEHAHTTLNTGRKINKSSESTRDLSDLDLWVADLFADDAVVVVDDAAAASGDDDDPLDTILLLHLQRPPETLQGALSAKLDTPRL